MRFIKILAVTLIAILTIFSCTEISEDNVKKSNIQGYLYNYADSSSMAGVHLELDTGETTTSNENGYYIFENVKAATHTVYAEYNNFYESWDEVLAKGGQTAQRDLFLVPDTVSVNYQINKTSINFGANLEEITLSLVNSENPIPLEINLEYSANWLHVYPTTASLYPNQELDFDLRVYRDSVEQGTFYDSLKMNISNSTIYDSLLNIPVVMKKKDTLVVSPTELNFGSFYDSLEISLYNPGINEFEWTLQPDYPEWISFKDSSGTGREDNIRVFVDRSEMDENEYIEGNFSFETSFLEGESADSVYYNEIDVSCENEQVEYSTVYDIQYTNSPGEDSTFTSPYFGSTVEVQGIVHVKDGDKFYLTDPGGGAWHGVYVFDYNYPVQIGDNVQLTAVVDEYYGLTELKDLDTLRVISQNNAIPQPIHVETGDFAFNEAYEGVLIELRNVTVTHAQDEYGQWYVTDGSGICQIDDVLFYLEDEGINIIEGQFYERIRGVGSYSYGEYELLPRSGEDLVEGENEKE